jgi:hypothetical protein
MELRILVAHDVIIVNKTFVVVRRRRDKDRWPR